MTTLHTPGPLRVVVSDKRPSNIETLDATGNVVFSQRMPCFSSLDETKEDAINCVNFPPSEREAYAAANRRAIAGEVLRAAAPELLAELEKAHAIIQVMLNLIPAERKADMAEALAKVHDAAGATRFHERAAVIAKATGVAA